MDHRKISILVIDDCLEQAECLARLLEAIGHRASFVINPLDALDAAEGMHPDIIFVDLDMPNVDGWALARMFRQQFGDIRLVAVTGLDPQNHDVFDAWLTKPVRLGALSGILALESEAL